MKRISKALRLEYGCYQVLDRLIGRERVFEYMGGRRRSAYRKLTDSLEKGPVGRVIEVDRIKEISIDDFKAQYLYKNIPVIFEGAALSWPCVEKWSLDYLSENLGDDLVTISDQQKLENQARQMTLAQVIEEIKAGDDTYYRFYPLLRRHPSYLKHFDYQWFLDRRGSRPWLEAFQVFIGGEGSVTPLHNANQGNLFTQVFGEKLWYLYPVEYTMIIDPDPAPNVYRRAPFKTANGPFDPFNPSYKSPYNLYEHIDSYKVHLKPGDILWNPPFYWHAVKNLSHSIGVGYRWLSPRQAMRSSKLYSILDLFVSKPPIWKSYQMYKEDINLIHQVERGYFNK